MAWAITSDLIKTINGRKYILRIRETKYYAKRAARIYREEGYRVRIIKSDRYGEWLVYKSVRKKKGGGN